MNTPSLGLHSTIKSGALGLCRDIQAWLRLMLPTIPKTENRSAIIKRIVSGLLVKDGRSGEYTTHSDREKQRNV